MILLINANRHIYSEPGSLAYLYHENMLLIASLSSAELVLSIQLVSPEPAQVILDGLPTSPHNLLEARFALNCLIHVEAGPVLEGDLLGSPSMAEYSITRSCLAVELLELKGVDIDQTHDDDCVSMVMN